MRKYKNEEVIEKRRTIVSVTCNKCGEMDSLSTNEPNSHMNHFSAGFGFGSHYDMESWSFDLCEDCLTELIKTFKHVPAGFGEDNYSAHYPQATFEEWKETGVVNLEAGMTPEEIEANGGSIYADNPSEES